MVTNTPHLTRGFDEQLEFQIRRTVPGMAHWAASGPFGETCGSCRFLGYWKQRRNGSGETIGTARAKGCAEFHRLTGTHGPAPPKNTEACRHFQRKEEPQ
jgi:hypothetical protein